MYLLVREQLEYKILAIRHGINDNVETAELFYAGGASYQCDKCGMDLCNAYFMANQNDPSESIFCSYCINRALTDRNFLMKNRNIFKTIFNNPKKHSKLNPQSALVLMYRYMNVDKLLTRCGLDMARTHQCLKRNEYRILHQSLGDVERFPTELVSAQYCKVSSGSDVIHDKGLVATRDIPGSTYIAELKGNVQQLEHNAAPLNQFCFYVSEETVIDSSKHNCPIRYINHACKPNAALIESWKDIRRKHVFLVSLEEPISAGSEITIDYGKFRNHLFIDCLCNDCKPSSEGLEP